MIGRDFALASVVGCSDGRSQIIRRGEHVAFAASRVNERRGKAVVNFAAQAVDVHVNQIRERVEVLIPDVLGNQCARQHTATFARQVFEQGILFSRQFYLATGTRDLMSACVYDQIGDGQRGGTDKVAAPQQSAQACEQFGDCERLDEIIVRAHV